MENNHQKIYTELYFKDPKRVLDILNDNLIYFQDHFNHIYPSTDGIPENFSVPLLSNVVELSKIFNVENYFFELESEYGEGFSSKINLIKLFNDFSNQYNVTIKVDIDDPFCVYIEEDEFTDIFEISYKYESSVREKRTGIELIKDERNKQINFHEYSIESDALKFPEKELSLLASILLTQEPSIQLSYFPPKVDFDEFKNLKNKPYKERLIIAGALIAAELDKLKFNELKSGTDNKGIEF